MNYKEWSNLRKELHHDWLQNRYMTFLKSWKDCFDDVNSCDDNTEEVLEQLLQWDENKEALKLLLDNVEDALSPRQLLYEPPFDGMPDSNKKWLGDVIHALYCERIGVKERVDVMRWGHAMIRPRPGFIWGQARLTAARPYRGIHFANTDLSGVALFEEAFYHGLRAADEVLAGMRIHA